MSSDETFVEEVLEALRDCGLERLERLLGHRAVQVSPLTRTLRIPTPRAHVDILFDELLGNLRFEWLRSRSVAIPVGGHAAVVAALEDVIASKEAAGRKKDIAQLPILRDTLRVRTALEDEDITT